MIGLISCSAQKLDRAAPARELYTSALFRGSLSYAERRCSSVFVLSAKHGLVELDQVVEPYNLKLNDLNRKDRAAWATYVATALDRTFEDRREEPTLRWASFLLLAGVAYTAPLVLELVEGWRVHQDSIEQPLARMQIGQRLAFLAADHRAAARKDAA